ncbi:MFS transporter [Vannielia sp.]|uniref:MFS transporter n=1 Tax=Vannielia sp. TaxID=2813045 RepID=UPI00261D08D7|nr:MFS transporter [Vannielia sp.]MDF1871564.1 MFS transporter [Vannielia sp.]
MSMPISSDRTNWPLVALLYGLGLLAAGHFAKVALTLDALALRYPEAGATLPLTVSMTSVAGILFGATAGIVVARFGARRLLLVAIAAGALLAGLEAVPLPFGLFLALRVVEGFAHLALVVAGPTLMAASARTADRPMVMGLWGTFFGVGFMLFSLAEQALGMGIYLAHGGALALLGVAIAPLLPRRVGRGPVVAEGWLARHGAIYLSARRVAPALMFFWHTLMFMALLTYLPDFLGGWASPVLPLVALVGTFGAGALTRRVPPAPIGMMGFALGLLLMLAFWGLPELRAVLCFPLMLAFGAVPGAAFASVPWLNSDPADQARANGAIAQLGNVGTALTIPVFTLALAFGLGGLVALSVGISGVGIVVIWLIFGRAVRS